MENPMENPMKKNNEKFGFIMTRHVISEETNKYWNTAVKLLRTFYPLNKIVIIDDNSNKQYLDSDFPYANVIIIESEYPNRGELLPYYYYLREKFFDNAVILHDSVFIHKKINFDKLNGDEIKVMPLWNFKLDKENITNTLRIIDKLKNASVIRKKIVLEDILLMKHDKWFGCFGCQTYINHNFLKKIEEKYNITNLTSVILCRDDRCCLERIFGCIFFIENYTFLSKYNSIFGNIMTDQKWGLTFKEYIENMNTPHKINCITKVWTGR